MIRRVGEEGTEAENDKKRLWADRPSREVVEAPLESWKEAVIRPVDLPSGHPDRMPIRAAAPA